MQAYTYTSTDCRLTHRRKNHEGAEHVQPRRVSFEFNQSHVCSLRLRARDVATPRGHEGISPRVEQRYLPLQASSAEEICARSVPYSSLPVGSAGAWPSIIPRVRATPACDVCGPGPVESSVLYWPLHSPVWLARDPSPPMRQCACMPHLRSSSPRRGLGRPSRISNTRDTLPDGLSRVPLCSGSYGCPNAACGQCKSHEIRRWNAIRPWSFWRKAQIDGIRSGA